MRPISSSALRGLRGPLRAAAGRGEPDQGVGDASQNPGNLFVALMHVVERIGRDDLRHRTDAVRGLQDTHRAPRLRRIEHLDDFLGNEVGKSCTLSSAPARFRRWTTRPLAGRMATCRSNCRRASASRK